MRLSLCYTSFLDANNNACVPRKVSISSTLAKFSLPEIVLGLLHSGRVPCSPVFW